jgi:putative tricarboxylic transport membrane protein
VPVILGILLGNQMENNLRRAMSISDGNLWALLESPLAVGLWMMAIVGFILPLVVGRFVRISALKKSKIKAGDVGTSD